MSGSHDASQIKRFFKDSATYAVSGMATTFIGVVMVPIYTRVFSPTEYGALDLIATLLAFLNLFLLMGQQSAVGRFYTDADGDRDRRLSASTSAFFIGVLSASVVAVLLVFHKGIAGLLLESTTYSLALAAALAAVPFTILFRFLQNMLRWRREPNRYLAVSVGSMAVGLSVTIYLVVVARMGVAGVYIAMLLNSFIFCWAALFLARSSFAWAFSRARLGELLRFGVPLVPVAIAYYLIMYSDRYFLRYFEGLETVGLFALGVRVSSVLALMLNGFQMAIGPFVYSHYKDEHAPETFAKTFDYVSVAVTLTLTALAVFAADIVLIVGTATYLDAQSVVPLLAAGTASYGLGSYFSFGIGIAKKTVHRAWTGALAAGINVALNIILIPRMGLIGAGVATACSLFILAAMQMVISQRLYRVPYRFKKNLAIYIAAGVVVILTYAAGLDRPGLSLVPLKAVMVAGVLGVAAAAGLVSRTEFGYLGRLFTGLIRRGRE